ncbi:unnamed protein product [Cylicocyclus nassatus]|uniref:Snake toxin/toxin-like domain-containing protein n=1 Tax=Cylicocyclus nassatus TaxID=53992 RepID=A0AA36GVX4_CYLNA|nr:unnamed protein product [Cylicocyclus nassatus]
MTECAKGFFVLLLLYENLNFGCLLRCYSCSLEYAEDYDEGSRDALCGDKSFLGLGPDETVRTCAPWETICVTTLQTLHNTIAKVERGCAEECPNGCEFTGYGPSQVECTDCCEDDLCNGRFSLSYYYKVMRQQYGSWFTPVNGEIEWNKEQNLIFRY